MSRLTTRRRMLQTTTAAAAGFWIAAPRPAWAASESPNEKLNIAGIGVGGRGGENVSAVASENLVALCDVDENRAAASFERFPKARRYRDYRRMFDEMGQEIDAVIIGTPDHTHAPPAAMAMKLGKHCYCEKPLAHSVWECRVLTELAEQHKLVTQLGTQIHAGDNYRRVVELVQAGTIGPVRQVEVWHPGAFGGMDRPKDTPPVPPTLDWNLWLGPAPERPYHPAYAPFGWRHWWDFGNGTLGDFGCHYMDLPFWALRLSHPTRVEAEGPPPHPESAAPRLTVRYDFPPRGDLPPVRLTWRNGPGNLPEIIEQRGIPAWGAAVLFVGETGMLLADYGRRLLLPEEKFANVPPPEPWIPASIGHHREWIEACKSGGDTTCPFRYSGPLSETALLGNVSYRVGSPLEWDAPALKAKNCPEAEILIRRPYRHGWSL